MLEEKMDKSSTSTVFLISAPLVTASLSECRLYQISKWDYIQNLDINRKTYVFYVQGKYCVMTNKAETQNIAVTL
jgi:hypothetical protein